MAEELTEQHSIDINGELVALAYGDYFLKSFYERARVHKVKLPSKLFINVKWQSNNTE